MALAANAAINAAPNFTLKGSVAIRIRLYIVIPQVAFRNTRLSWLIDQPDRRIFWTPARRIWIDKGAMKHFAKA